MTSKTTNKFSPEVRARAVRMVLDHASEHPSRWAAVTSIAAKIGCTPQTLHDWVKKAEVDSGRRAGVPTDMAEKLKALERENRELRQANEILRKASAYFRWRSSTAGPSHDRLHRRSSWGAWGRADLQGFADRPLDLPRQRGQAAGSRQAVGARHSIRTSASTARARSGGSSSVRASMLPVARCRD
ncbi:transposase-like protein [Bradyrhizobium sp. LM2.7]